VFEILKVQLTQKNQPNRKSIINDSSEFVRAVIRRQVHGFYISNDILARTVDKILTTVNDDLKLSNFKMTAVYQLLKNMIFKPGKGKRKSCLCG
jgi:hypothetical protein